MLKPARRPIETCIGEVVPAASTWRFHCRRFDEEYQSVTK